MLDFSSCLFLRWRLSNRSWVIDTLFSAGWASACHPAWNVWGFEISHIPSCWKQWPFVGGGVSCKSCTTWWEVYPTICRAFYIWGGAGCLPTASLDYEKRFGASSPTSNVAMKKTFDAHVFYFVSQRRKAKVDPFPTHRGWTRQGDHVGKSPSLWVRTKIMVPNLISMIGAPRPKIIQTE